MALPPNQLKKTPTDQWSVREKLALASSVERTRDQNWVSVSRQIKSFAEPNRPADWFSQKNCALQYGYLLENVEHPKRKRGEEIATPGSLIVKKLTQERIAELEKLVLDGYARHQKLRKELDLITAGRMDDKIDDLIDELNQQAEEKNRQEAAHQRWLKDRELGAERQRQLRLHMLAAQKTKKQPRTISDNSDSMQSDDSNLAGHSLAAPESPLPPQPPASSSLLTSLLRSPSDSPNQSPRTSHGPTTIAAVPPPSQTASSLLLPQPLSHGQRSQSTDSQQSGSGTPVHTPTSSQAPTLSKLLEQPPETTMSPTAGDDKKSTMEIKTEVTEIKQEILEDSMQGIERTEVVQTTPDGKEDQAQPTKPASQEQPPQTQQSQEQEEQLQQDQQCTTTTDRLLEDALSVLDNVANGSQPTLEAAAVQEVPDSEIVSYIDEMRQDMEQGAVQTTVEEQQQKQMIAAQLRQSVEEVVATKTEPDTTPAVVPLPQVKQEPAEVVEEPTPPPQPAVVDITPEVASNSVASSPAPVQVGTTNRSNPPSRESTPATTKVPSRSASPVRVQPPPTPAVTVSAPAPAPKQPAVATTTAKAPPVKSKETVCPTKEKERAKMSIKIPSSPVAKEKVATPPPKTPTKTRESTPTPTVPPVKPREAEVAPVAKPPPQSSRSTPTRTTKKSEDEALSAAAVPTPAPAVAAPPSTTAAPVPSTEPTVTTTTPATTAVSTTPASEERNEDTDDKSQSSSNTNAGDEAASGLDSQETESREDSVDAQSPSIANNAEEETREEAPVDVIPKECNKETTKEPVVVVALAEKERADDVKDAKEETSVVVEEEPVDEMIEEEVSEDEDLVPGPSVGADERDLTEQAFRNNRSKEAGGKDDETKDATALGSLEDEEDVERAEERERDLKIWKKSALLVWRTAANHSHAGVFMTPVTDEMAPGYADIVYRPMDLTAIRRGIETGTIRTTLELLRDMMLMFQNAIMYNSADHDVYHKAMEMRLDVIKQIEEWMANEAAERGSGGSSPLLLGLGAAIGVKRAARHRHSEGTEPPAKKPRRSTGVGGAK